MSRLAGRLSASPFTATTLRIGGLALLAGLFLFVYLYNIGSNPAGMFCDEAQIGVEAYRLPMGEADLQPIPLFVRNFDYVHLGVMPALSTMPFVWLFGADEFGIRLAAAAMTLATLLLLYITLHRLKIPFPSLAVALFGLSPAVIHVGRVNLGHAPSMLLLALGFYLYVRARTQHSAYLAVAAGLCFGLGAYSNGPFYVFVPMLIAAIGIGESCFNGRNWRDWKPYAWTAGVCALLMLPFAYELLTNPEFLKRFADKQFSHYQLLSGARLLEMIANYPKYFSIDYLFRVGETGLPGGWITRHSVPGAGELNWMLLPMLALAVIGLVRCWRHPSMRFLVPWVAIAIAYPFPDLLTATAANPPYTFALMGATLAIPFLAALGLLGLWSLLPERPRLAMAAASLMLLATLGFGMRFYMGPYQAYPLISAGWFGWQFGPRQMIGYFKAHADDYDYFLMDGNYNGAVAFLELYLTDPEMRRKATLNDLRLFDPTKRQLFSVRAEVWNNQYDAAWPAKDLLRVLAVIPYPNGEPAVYMVEARR